MGYRRQFSSWGTSIYNIFVRDAVEGTEDSFHKEAQKDSIQRISQRENKQEGTRTGYPEPMDRGVDVSRALTG